MKNWQEGKGDWRSILLHKGEKKESTSFTEQKVMLPYHVEKSQYRNEGANNWVVFIWGSSLLILSGVEHARTPQEHKDYREMFSGNTILDLRGFNFFKCYQHINPNKANRGKTMMSKIFDWQKLKQKLLRSREDGLDYIWSGDYSQNQWNFWKGQLFGSFKWIISLKWWPKIKLKIKKF